MVQFMMMSLLERLNKKECESILFLYLIILFFELQMRYEIEVKNA